MMWTQSNAALKLEAPPEAQPRATPDLAAGTWEIDPHTGEPVLSKRSKELLGIDPREPATALRVLGALHADDRERWADAIAGLFDIDGEGVFVLTLRVVAGDRWVKVTGQAEFEGIRVVRLLGTIADVAPSNHDRGRAAVSDESGRAELRAAMHFAAHRMRRIMDQDLRFACSTGLEVKLNRRHVRLAAVCRKAMTEAALAYPGRQTRFDYWDDASGVWDDERLHQLLRDLLSNALSHGAVDAPAMVSVVDCGDEALLIVANRGLPIPDRFRDYLLDPVVRWPSSSDHLGLFSVKAIVQAHGGRLELSSDDLGSVFHIWLPKHEVEVEGAPS